MKKSQLILFIILLFSILNLIYFDFLIKKSIPDIIFIERKQKFKNIIKFKNKLPFSICIKFNNIKTNQVLNLNKKIKNLNSDENEQINHNAKVSILNIPIKYVNVKEKKRKNVIPCGIPFGMQISNSGVMVVKTGKIETKEGEISPSEKAGIKFGDIILKVNGNDIEKSNTLSEISLNSNGQIIKLLINRNGKIFYCNVKPVKSIHENKYQVGIWVREISAGLGTLSFINIEDKSFIGLGHGLRDETTNNLLPLYNGEIFSASINSVKKSFKGYPGELKGSITDRESIGKILKNLNNGIYGFLKNYDEIIKKLNLINTNSIPVAFKQEINIGEAKILCTLSGNKPKSYECFIENINLNNKNINKNLIIKITDNNFLKISEGIVKGMSGSPIIQNERLVAILNHVSINNPIYGYAIFAENLIYDNEIL